MQLFSSRRLISAILPSLIASGSLITGCGTNLQSLDDPQPGIEIHGAAYGGQFPITGAHIYLMAANTTTLKGASNSLLTKGDGSDSVGEYVLTQSDGSFSVSNDYTCMPNTQVYALAMQGNPGQPAGTNNTSATMIALLGNCPSGGTFLGAIPYIVINEVSTVAAAYSVAAFASDYKDIGGPNATGLKNAFLSASNLYGLGTGQAYAKTPPVSAYPGALSANGIVPQTKIYALANSLAACVNSDGSTGAGTGCGSLYTETTAGGVTPGDVFDAALNVAHNPAITTTNTNLYALGTKNAPFSPGVVGAPADWTISIKYSAPNTSYPARPAADLSGNVWIPNVGNNSLTELSPTGVVLSGTGGFTGGALDGPSSIAIDTTSSSSVVWVANYNNGTVAKFNLSGTPASAGGYSTTNGAAYSAAMQGSTAVFAGDYGVTAVTGGGTGRIVDSINTVNVGVTVDPSSNIWAAQYLANSISKLAVATSTTYSATSYTGGGLNEPTSLASDSAGDIWVVNAGASVLSGFKPNGTPISSAGYSGGGLLKAYAVRVDSAGYVYTGNTNGSISVFGSGTGTSGTAGAALSGSNGYATASTASYTANPGATFDGIAPSYGIVGMAIDLSGNVWAPDLDGSLYEFVGLAAPVAP